MRKEVPKYHQKRKQNKDIRSKYYHKFISPKEIEEMKEDPYDIAFNNEISLNDIIDEYVIKDPGNCRRYLNFKEEHMDKYDWDIEMNDFDEQPICEYQPSYKGNYHANMQRYTFNKSSIDKSKMYCSPSPKKSKNINKNSTEK